MMGLKGVAVLIVLAATIAPGSARPSGPTALHAGAEPSGSIDPDYAFNAISIDGDDLDGATRIFGISALSIIHRFGAGSGSRNSLVVEGDLIRPMKASSDSQFFVAAYLRELALSGDGGRPGHERGAIFAINPVAEAHAGARDLLEVAGAEVDVGLLDGSSATRRTGIRLASQGRRQASYLDSALDLTGGDVGWGFGLLFQSDLGHNPVNGTLIGAHADATPLVAASGIDLGEYRFTTGIALRLPDGFMVRDGKTLAAEVAAPRVIVQDPPHPTSANQAVLALPTSTRAHLGSGRVGYLKVCTDCRKPGEGRGQGTGMLEFFDGHGWRSSATGAAAAD